MSNSRIEVALQKIKEDSIKYKLAHINISNRSNSIYNVLTITGMCIGPILTVLTRLEDNCNGINMVSISVMALGILSGVIGSVIKFGKYPETVNSHKIAAAGYLSIETNIYTQLNLDESERIPLNEYIKWVHAKFQDLFDSSPLLSNNIYKTISEELEINIPKENNIPKNTDRLIQYELERLKAI